MTTQREIERRLDDLETSASEYPEAGLIRLLSTPDDEPEVVDRERDIVRCSGNLYRIDPGVKEVLSADTGRANA